MTRYLEEGFASCTEGGINCRTCPSWFKETSREETWTPSSALKLPYPHHHPSVLLWVPQKGTAVVTLNLHSFCRLKRFCSLSCSRPFYILLALFIPNPFFSPNSMFQRKGHLLKYPSSLLPSLPPAKSYHKKHFHQFLQCLAQGLKAESELQRANHTVTQVVSEAAPLISILQSSFLFSFKQLMPNTLSLPLSLLFLPLNIWSQKICYLIIIIIFNKLLCPLWIKQQVHRRPHQFPYEAIKILPH